MIPKFPNFKKITTEDRKDIEFYTNQYPPYSDFNFTSLWAWDTKNQVLVSSLNNNLVVLFTDYINNEQFFSFLGKNKFLETIRVLLEFSKTKKIKSVLKLIPSEFINSEVESIFKIITDPDSYDYIYAVSHLSNMHNWKQHSSGQNVRSYSQKFPDYIIKRCKINKVNKNEYLNIFKDWAKNKGVENYIELNEYEALKRFFEINQDNVELVSLYVDGVLVGFTIYEIISPDYAISHFAKANIKHHRAISDILNWEESKILNTLGIKYFNWEQDLGIPSLRKSKEKYKPDFLLKKVIIEFKD